MLLPKKITNGIGIITLSTILLSSACSPGYEPISSQQAYDIYKRRAPPRSVEVTGTMIDVNNGFLYFGTPLISAGVQTDCEFRMNKAKADKLSDVLEKIGNPDGLEFTVKGSFSGKKSTIENFLYVKQVIIQTSSGKTYHVNF